MDRKGASNRKGGVGDAWMPKTNKAQEKRHAERKAGHASEGERTKRTENGTPNAIAVLGLPAAHFPRQFNLGTTTESVFRDSPGLLRF